MIEASLLYVTSAAGHIPPVVEKMSGVNEACSTSLTLSSYALLFSCSFCRYIYYRPWIVEARKLGASGLKTLMSKTACCLWPQKSSATMSSFAPSSLLADL